MLAVNVVSVTIVYCMETKLNIRKIKVVYKIMMSQINAKTEM